MGRKLKWRKWGKSYITSTRGRGEKRKMCKYVCAALKYWLVTWITRKMPTQSFYFRRFLITWIRSIKDTIWSNSVFEFSLIYSLNSSADNWTRQPNRSRRYNLIVAIRHGAATPTTNIGLAIYHHNSRWLSSWITFNQSKFTAVTTIDFAYLWEPNKPVITVSRNWYAVNSSEPLTPITRHKLLVNLILLTATRWWINF